MSTEGLLQHRGHNLLLCFPILHLSFSMIVNRGIVKPAVLHERIMEIDADLKRLYSELHRG